MNQLQEYLETLNELRKTEAILNEKNMKSLLQKKVKLAEKEKMYRKLSDIEYTLSRIECHTNEQLKLNKFMAKMLCCSVHLSGNRRYADHEKVMTDYWQEYLRIRD